MKYFASALCLSLLASCEAPLPIPPVPPPAPMKMAYCPPTKKVVVVPVAVSTDANERRRQQGRRAIDDVPAEAMTPSKSVEFENTSNIKIDNSR
ncbi:MAG: hypothetical protein ABL949_16375 [Fimbriimonadaceae bacterium]